MLITISTATYVLAIAVLVTGGSFLFLVLTNRLASVLQAGSVLRKELRRPTDI